MIDAANPWIAQSPALEIRDLKFEDLKIRDSKFSNPQISNFKSPDSPCLPPSVIVGFSATGTSCCPGGSAGFPPCTTTEIYSLETYCKHVLPNEWVASWNQPAAFRAAAVAIRSYVVYKVNNPAYNGYDICSSPCCQNFGNTNATTSAAVDFTAGYVLQLPNGTVASTEYSAENNHLLPTCAGNNPGMGCADGQFFWSGTCYTDSVGLGKNLYGHGRGMSQRGSARWASGRNMNTCSNTLQQSQHGLGTKTWQQILALYYPTLTLVNCTPPPNDACAAAAELTSFADTCVWTAGTALNATPSGLPIPACSGYTSATANDVWYRFTATHPTHTLTADPEGATFSNQYVDPVIAVYAGCTAADLLQCEDDTGGGGGNCAMTVNDLTPGQTYYVRVYDYGGTVPPLYHGFDICLRHTLPAQLPNLTQGAVPAGVAVSGNMLQLNAVVANNGPGAADSSVLVYYLSTAPDFATLDYLIGLDTLEPLASGQSTALSTVIDLCESGVPDGTYYLAYAIDDFDAVAETAETDNFWPVDTITVQCVVTGMPTAAGERGWRLYPNPAHDRLTVEVEAGLVGHTLDVYNALGQTLLRRPIDRPNVVLETNQWPAGVYRVRIRAGATVLVKTFVRE